MIRTDVEPPTVSVGELRDLWRKLRAAVPGKQWGILVLNAEGLKKARAESGYQRRSPKTEPLAADQGSPTCRKNVSDRKAGREVNHIPYRTR